jgi:F420H2:quinone oxidoreductase subunit B/C
LTAEALAQAAAKLGAKVSVVGKSDLIEVGRADVVRACEAVASIPGMYHLTTITGVDEGDEIVLLYHFWQGRRFVTVKTRVPKKSPTVSSIVRSLPSATLYEAEIRDMLGVTFDGNPYSGKKLLLPDNYPEDAPPPLTKEADPEKIRRMLELE